MQVVIAGSRDLENYDFVVRLIESCPFISEATEIVHGNCRGVDKIADKWGRSKGLKVTPVDAEWTKLGNAAGPIRNEKMAKYAQGGGAVIIQKGKSKGSQSMLEMAQKYNLKIHHIEVQDKDVFSLASLKELQKQLEGKQFVGGDLARKLLDQQIKQLTEYQAVIRDCKSMIETLQRCMKDFKGYNELSVSNDTFSSIEKSLNSPTAKFIQSLNENNK